MRVKELRKKKGYTQEKLAELMNLKRSSIAGWESKSNCLPRKMETLRKLTIVLDCTVDELLSD